MRLVPLALLLASCSTLDVQAPVCEPPAIPPALLEPCEEPQLPNDATLAGVYENYVANVVGPWARCIRKDDKLIEIVKYRDQVCAKLRADNPPAKHWWQR